MVVLCAKLKQREKNKYRIIMTLDKTIYIDEDIKITTATPYEPGAALEDGDWFSITSAANRKYSIDLMSANYTAIDFNSLTREEFGKVDFIFVEIDNMICFQNISKTQLISQKSILCLGEGFTYQGDRKEIVIKAIPDAIYDKNSDVLYFRRLGCR